MFDGWTEVIVHYIGVSASYATIVENVEVVSQILLSRMRPLLIDDIKGMTALDHIRYKSKTDANIVCYVGGQR